MKLVNILARDLEEWAPTTAFYVQDADGSIWPCTQLPEWDGSEWHLGEEKFIDQSMAAKALPRHQLSEDYRIATVTRAEWEAAVEAMIDAGYRKP